MYYPEQNRNSYYNGARYPEELQVRDDYARRQSSRRESRPSRHGKKRSSGEVNDPNFNMAKYGSEVIHLCLTRTSTEGGRSHIVCKYNNNTSSVVYERQDMTVRIYSDILGGCNVMQVLPKGIYIYARLRHHRGIE